MAPEFGNFALILSFSLALVQGLIPLMGTALNKPTWQAVASSSVVGQTLFQLTSFTLLIYCYLHYDFSMSYVVAHAGEQLPWYYRVSAIWTGHEGALTLWSVFLALWSCVISLTAKRLNPSTRHTILAILGIINAIFLLYIIINANPFGRVLPNAPVEGQDLAPLLKEPGLVLHLPLLFLSYTAFAVTFAFALTALIEGKINRAWVVSCRRWALFAWTSLGFVMMFSSWWSYSHLGWAGLWFWNPIESSSLIPWLLCTALIYALVACEKRNIFQHWVILLSMGCFASSLFGAFWIRAGVLLVNGYRANPSEYTSLIIALSILFVMSLLLYVWRSHHLRCHHHFKILSRESTLVVNNVLLVVLAASIFFALIYPLVIKAAGGQPITVGPSYFNLVLLPMVLLVLVLMGIGPHCQWGKMSWRRLFQKVGILALLSAACGFLLAFILGKALSIFVVVGLILGLWLFASAFKLIGQHLFSEGKNGITVPRVGMYLGYFGMALCVIGFTLTTHFSIEKDRVLNEGQQTTLGNYRVQFNHVTKQLHTTHESISGHFHLLKDNQVVEHMRSNRRVYLDGRLTTNQPAIAAGLLSDIYIVLGKEQQSNRWQLRLYYKPFIRWVWFGALLMILGGLLAMWTSKSNNHSIKGV